jgi:hypothetical protein
VERAVSEPDPYFELICHLVSSARGAPEEGVYTASLRLIHAAGKLAELRADGDPYLTGLAARVADESSAAYMRSPEEYVAFLDEAVAEMAAEVRRRAGF